MAPFGPWAIASLSPLKTALVPAHVSPALLMGPQAAAVAAFAMVVAFGWYSLAMAVAEGEDQKDEEALTWGGNGRQHRPEGMGLQNKNGSEDQKANFQRPPHVYPATSDRTTGAQ